MEFKRLDKRKGSGAASIRSRYAYLIHLPDIDYFPPVNEKGVRLEGDIVLHEGRTMIPVYLTNPSQEYSYDTPGGDDEKTFLVKFTGTHPGTELEALEFSKNLLEHPFLVLIPGCEKNAPSKLLGQLDNPLIFTSTHKAGRDGDKFTFNFEQRIGSEFIYFSYGGVISLPPSPDGPPSDPGHSGFDPTKWARIDASNIDPHIAAWRAKLITEPEDPTEEETASAPNSRLEDGWRTINNTAPLSIVLGNDPAGSFHLTGAGDIAGFTTKMGKFMWPGRVFYFKTDKAVTLRHAPQEPTTNAKYYSFAEDFTTKPDGWYILKEKASFIEVVELGGGADFPEGNPGDVLVKTADGEVFSSRLTDAENELDTEIVERAMADALKLDKPLAPNNVATKVVNADGSTTDKTTFERTIQVAVPLPATVDTAWMGRIIFFSGVGTLTVPATLPADFSFQGLTKTGCTVTMAIIPPKAWATGTPTQIPPLTTFFVAQEGNTNAIYLLM